MRICNKRRFDPENADWIQARVGYSVRGKFLYCSSSQCQRRETQIFKQHLMGPSAMELFPFIYTISPKKSANYVSPWRIILPPHNDIITPIQTLVEYQ